MAKNPVCGMQVEADMALPRYGEDLGPQRGHRGVRRNPCPIPLREGARTVGPEGPAEPQDLARGEPQRFDRLCGGDPVGPGRVRDMEPVVFCGGQCRLSSSSRW